MKGTPAVYLGRIVEKKHFRAFVYGPNGEKKLVESWDAFEACMESGLWFASTEDAEISKSKPVEPVEEEEIEVKPTGKSKPKPKPKPKGTTRAKVEVEDESEDELQDDGSVFEVKNDKS